jgi:hypothetical protein
MDKKEILKEIFTNDPLGLLKVKPKKTKQNTEGERLVASFEEINAFVENNGREPEANPSDISESQLYYRLKSLRENLNKTKQLKPYDTHNLLPSISPTEVNEPEAEYKKEINSIDDILGDDSLDILGGDDADLFNFKHTPKDYERAQADFVARRKPCKDFEKYEQLFKSVQNDLKSGKRKLIDFNEKQLKAGSFFIHNGVLLLLDKTINLQADKVGKIDGRTRVIFENGTESGMKYRSLGKNLFINGRAVTDNIDKVNEGFIESFNSITDEDEEAGYIYVLKSKSTDENISNIQDLYKVGYSKTAVEERIKHAEKEPTYLMAPVSIQGVWKCYNMNPQKFEQLLHNFFGNSCLELDVFDEKGKRHTPREWFITPIEIIEQAIELIINGKIINYKYDAENKVIVIK